MAKMIPAELDKETRSSAERKLYYLFRDMPGTEDWYVLHSVALARHPTQTQGESDFVIIIPDGGVFVLEVKGGIITYENGIWYSTNQGGTRFVIKNPVAEANNGMHGLMQYIEKNNKDNLHWSVFGFGIVFPDATVHGRFKLPDVDDLQIADSDDLSDMKSYLLKLAGFWRSRKGSKVFVPKKPQADAIAAILRPNYDLKLSIASQIRSVEKQIITLTDNQRNVFEGLLENERCLIRGSAGTGKTVLAMEAARTFAAQGKKVALFCYNRLLAGWLKENIGENENIVCESLTDYMEDAVRGRFDPAMKDQDHAAFYNETLPTLYAEHFIEEQLEPFDCVIIDEAQDVFDSRYLEDLDLLIAGGLKEGNWYFFLDAEKQNIYFGHTTYEAITKTLTDYHCYYTNYALHHNCRNSQAIIEKIDSIYGTHTQYRKMESRGSDVVIRQYKREPDQEEIVEFILRQLQKEQIPPDDIVLLSAVRFDRSVASSLSLPISSDRTNRKGKLLFSTIHSFKGLESPVVLLLDFSSLDHEQQLNLLYVGMTRARSALYMVVSDKAEKALENRIREASKNE